MRRKELCAECKNIHRASSLHRSMEDHKMLCYICYAVENKNRKELKLRDLRDVDEELTNPTEKRRRLSMTARLFKFGSGLLKGKKR